jgi:hypothetical protein
MFTGVLISRKVFIIFGGLGFFGYLGHLSWMVFRDSILFPFALTALGLVVVFLGWIYHKKQAAINRFVYAVTPSFIVAALPHNRRRGG